MGYGTRSSGAGDLTYRPKPMRKGRKVGAWYAAAERHRAAGGIGPYFARWDELVDEHKPTNAAEWVPVVAAWRSYCKGLTRPAARTKPVRAPKPAPVRSPSTAAPAAPIRREPSMSASPRFTVSRYANRKGDARVSVLMSAEVAALLADGAPGALEALRETLGAAEQRSA
jgi:hypothetical protein